MNEPSLHANGPSLPGPFDHPDAFLDPEPALIAECAERYERVLRDLVLRLFGDDKALAESALETGSFSLDELTIVMRFDAERDMVEFFCDVGLPDSHRREQSFFNILEYNLCRTYPGIVFGVHPQSERIVATASTHVLLLPDADACLVLLNMMTDCVKDLIEKRVVMLE